MRNTFTNPIYPGGIFGKRIRHGLILCTLGLTLFFNQTQQYLFDASTAFIKYSTELTDPAVTMANGVGSAIIPQIQALQNSRFQIIADYLLPKPQTITKKLDGLNDSQKRLFECGKMLEFTAEVLKWANVLFFLSIAYSAFWMLIDLGFGKSRRFSALVWVGAFATNVCTYIYLSQYLNLITFHT